MVWNYQNTDCSLKNKFIVSLPRDATLLLLHPFNDLFSKTAWVSRYQKGKTSLNLKEARDYRVLGWPWHQLDYVQTICTSLQTDNHTNTSSLNFYWPDALPDVQTTVSKHWRQKYRDGIIYIWKGVLPSVVFYCLWLDDGKREVACNNNK